MIKFSLVKFDGLLMFQIIEQSGEFGKFLEAYHANEYYDGENNIELRCSDIPELRSERDRFIVYLRGRDKSQDFCICEFHTSSNTYRDHLYNRIIKALELFSNKILEKV